MTTDVRGMTLRQLRAFYAHIEEACERDQWVNMKGELLRPRDVVLYDACRYVIKPATEAWQCSYVQFVADSPSAQRPKWCKSLQRSATASTFVLH